MDLDDPPARAPERNAPVIQRNAPAAAGSSVLHTLQARIENYERAVAQATLDNESARLRRFEPVVKQCYIFLDHCLCLWYIFRLLIYSDICPTL